MKDVTFSKDALRALSRMPANTAVLIRAKIRQYAADPASQANNVRALKGQGGIFRLRVGDWRVLLTETGEVISVIRIAPRGRAYDQARSPMTVQIITTPSGERLVILPETEYEELVAAAEDAADAAAVERFRRRLAAGEEELVPSAVVDRILGGENRVRVWREHRGLTASALAEAAGLDPSQVTEVEGGGTAVQVDTLRRLAAALNLSLDDLAG